MGEYSDRFLLAYNRLDDRLRSRTKSDRSLGFSDVTVRAEKSAFVSSFDAARLRKFGILRNAIVHDERFPKEVVAEPHVEIVEEIEQILDRIDGSKTVHSISTKNPRIFKPNDMLREALQEMGQGDFSQVIVQDERVLQLLTADAIAKWIESNFDEEIIELTTLRISDVLAHERSRRYRVVPRKLSLSAAIANFEDAASWSDDRLFALLVTDSGKPTEKCIGIVTPADAFGAGR